MQSFLTLLGLLVMESDQPRGAVRTSILVSASPGASRGLYENDQRETAAPKCYEHLLTKSMRLSWFRCEACKRAHHSRSGRAGDHGRYRRRSFSASDMQSDPAPMLDSLQLSLRSKLKLRTRCGVLLPGAEDARAASLLLARRSLGDPTQPAAHNLAWGTGIVRAFRITTS